MILEITGIGAELQGVGRAESGQVVFVPFALPGETVDVEIVRESERFLEGRVKEILQPSADRVEPVCPLYGRCGGCRAQHMTYERSLELKRQTVRQQLERIGGLQGVEVRPTLGAQRTVGYRNKAEFAVATDPVTRQPYAGVRELGSNAVLPISECMIQDPLSLKMLNIAIDWMRRYRILACDAGRKPGGVRYIVTRVNAAGEMMLIVSTDGERLDNTTALYDMLRAELGEAFKSLYHAVLDRRPTHALDGKCRLLRGDERLKEELLGLEFDVSPRTFFQVNHAQTEVLYDCARQAAGLTGKETVIDAYCGCGTISLVMARDAAKVTGVELVSVAIENAHMNAKRNKLSDKTEFYAGDAGKLVVQMLEKGARPDVLVVDPPRKGVDSGLIDAMLKAKIGRIVYVSCNPGTLARDLKRLTEKGDYRVEYAQPVDMFALTEHVETVCSLVLRNPATHINIDVDVEELVQDRRGQATYTQIQQYVRERFGLNVSTLYISQIKRKCGIEVGDSYNKPKSEEARAPQCPAEKEAAIMDALKHYGFI